MYKIVKEPFGSLTKVKLINEETKSYASIIPEFGGNLNELVLNKNRTLHSILDGDADERSLREEGGTLYKGSHLGPYVNRVKKGQYNFEGKEYQLPVNEARGNALHGFLWDKNFEIIDEHFDKDSAKITLRYSYDGGLPGYPFLFLINVTYLLDINGLTIYTFIKNTGDSSMPFSDGWHPYFKTGCKIDELILQLPTDWMIMTDDNLIPNGKTKNMSQFLTGQKIGDTVLDNCFGPIENESAVIKLRDPVKDLDIIITLQSGKNKYQYIQIYTPTHRNTIAIEPNTCAPDAFNNGQGLIVLKRGEEVVMGFGVSVE